MRTGAAARLMEQAGMSSGVFIGLGSNLGDRREALGHAVDALMTAGIRVGARSRIYRTDPVEVLDQEEFLNQVVACESDLGPAGLLAACLQIERQMGRMRTRDKGPRRIDLDLLLYGSLILGEPGLVVPHPRMHLRRFVLVPLAEIAADVVHPVIGSTIAELLARCPDLSRVELDRSV